MRTETQPISGDEISALGLFGHDSPQANAEIASSAQRLSAPRGEQIIRQGMVPEGLYGVREGRLKLYLLGCNGEERVIRILEPGETFAEALMFNSIPSPVYVETLTPCILCFIPRDAIYAHLGRDPEFTLAMLQGMSGMLRQLIIDLETCCMHNALGRVAGYLLKLAEATPPPHCEIQLPATKSLVASTLNLSAETFSRELHRLEHQGVIRISRRTIYVQDLSVLQDRAGVAIEPAGSVPR
ncbi:MAG: Crp/Fnr family transcriptional regulator [Gammaproteobacteria bacterium]